MDKENNRHIQVCLGWLPFIWIGQKNRNRANKPTCIQADSWLPCRAEQDFLSSMFNLLNTHCSFTEAEMIPPCSDKNFLNSQIVLAVRWISLSSKGPHINLIFSSLFLIPDSSGAALHAKPSMKIVWLPLGQRIRGVSVSCVTSLIDIWLKQTLYCIVYSALHDP